MVDTAGILNAYLANLDSRINQLQQPAPQQGGILSGADPVMLSLAAGLLSPTKTGGFGESVAQGLSSAQGPLSDIRKQEAARADKLATLEQARAKLALDYMELQQGGRGGRPRDPSLNAKIYGDMAYGIEEQLTDRLKKQDPDRYNDLKKQALYYRKKALEISGFAEDEAADEESTGQSGPKPGPSTPQPAPSPKKEETGKTTATPYTGNTPPPKYPDARKGRDGYWYMPGPDGKWNQRIKVLGQ